MFDFIKSIFAPKVFTGVLPDTRPQSEKDNDVQHEEFLPGGIVQWIEKPQSQWKHFPQRDQSTSFSCVYQSTAKAIGVRETTFPVLSARRYNERSNYPAGGSIPYEALQKATQGFPLEFLYPSQGMDEQTIDTVITKSPQVIESQNEFSGGVAVQLPVDIDTIAQVLDQGYGVVGCYEFPYDEWTYMPVIGSKYANVGHQIAFVDRTIYLGQKCLIAEDSWLPKTSKNGQRIITEEYLKTRCYFAGYKKFIASQIIVKKPDHIFTSDMYFGLRNNEVVLLQTRLVSEQLLPADCITGYFLSLTKQAVIAYQKREHLPQTGYVGSLTRASLNG